MFLLTKQSIFVSRSSKMQRQGQGEPEGSPLPWRAVDADLAAMLLQNRLADIEAKPQANARPALHDNARRAIKALPDMHLLGRWQARPLVAHPDVSLPLFHPHPGFHRAICR